MIETAVLGATGYTGFELIRLLLGHPQAELLHLTSESHAGKQVSAVHPQFAGCLDAELKKLDVATIPASVKMVFCALPHGQSCLVVPRLLERGFKVIDLSADFRLKEASLYDTWYNRAHPAPEYLQKAVYGLPELYPKKIREAQLVANPGCYPTSVILALAPLIKAKAVSVNGIIIDSKSGVSGAGRTPKQPFHFPECTENFKAYRVASHQHIPEIEQELACLADQEVTVTFTPHLVPMIRGILSTIYLDFPEDSGLDQIKKLYSEFYSQKPFVRLHQDPVLPETRLVRGSNYCDLALAEDRRSRKLIIISAIDNLIKGASGQAVQNFNLMFGLPEAEGLGQLSSL